MTRVETYLKSLPVDRRAEIQAVRDVVNANLPTGYVEDVDYGMISWIIPLSTHPDTYNGHPLSVAALAAQKNHNALYLSGIYSVDDGALRAWFESAWREAGKKLNMGKACVRFSRASDLALDVIAQTITKLSVDEYLTYYKRLGQSARVAQTRTAARSLGRPCRKKPRPVARRSKRRNQLGAHSESPRPHGRSALLSLGGAPRVLNACPQRTRLSSWHAARAPPRGPRCPARH